MKRTFLINISFLLFVNLLIKPIYIFGIDRGVQNTIGQEEYGLYFALFDFAYLFQILNDFGIQTFNNRLISQRPQLLNSVFSNIIFIKFIFGLLFYVLIFSGAILFGYSTDIFPLLLVLATNHFLISLIFYLRSNISALGRYMVDSFISALDKIFMIIIIGYFLWWGPNIETFSLWDFVYGQMFSFILTAIVAFLILLPNLNFGKFRIRKKYILVLLKKSFPYAILVFLMTIYYRVDGFMIERLLTDGREQAGIYAASFRLLDAGNMLGFLFATLLLPMFSKMLKRGEDIYELTSSSSNILLAAVLPIALATILYKENIMMALYPEATAYWAEVLGILMMTFIVVSLSYITGALLLAGDKIAQLNRLFIVCAILNVALNFVLIKRSGASGAAMASFVTQGIVFVGQALLVFKYYINPRPSSILYLMFYLVLLSGLIYGVREMGDSMWLTKYVSIIGVGFILSFVVKLNKLSDFMELTKKSY